MNGRSWVRWLDSFSDNRKSKTCPELCRRIQNLKWLGLSVIGLVVAVRGTGRAEERGPQGDGVLAERGAPDRGLKAERFHLASEVG